MCKGFGFGIVFDFGLVFGVVLWVSGLLVCRLEVVAWVSLVLFIYVRLLV